MIPEADELNASLTFEELEFLDDYADEQQRQNAALLLAHHPNIREQWPAHLPWPPQS